MYVQKRILFTEGHFYSLEELGIVAHRLKMISTRRSDRGFFYLYKDGKTKNIWISGPLKNSSLNLFYLVGAKPIKSQLERYFLKEISVMISDWLIKSLELFDPSKGQESIE